MYDLALSREQSHQIKKRGWPFSSKLATEHVWDAFVILTLLEDHERRNLKLQVLHTGEQKDRFTREMEASNERVIQEGQSEVPHYCDKCMRVYKDRDGTLCTSESLFSISFSLTNHIPSQVPGRRNRWPYPWPSMLWGFPVYETFAEQSPPLLCRSFQPAPRLCSRRLQ
jgi:hypothetical protein